jgi:SNF2 family DNA or RNA helicase
MLEFYDSITIKEDMSITDQNYNISIGKNYNISIENFIDYNSVNDINLLFINTDNNLQFFIEIECSKIIELIFIEYYYNFTDIFKIKQNIINMGEIELKIFIDTTKDLDFRKSPAFNCILKNILKIQDLHNIINIKHLSFYSTLPEPQQDYNFCNLYDYQKKNIQKMINIENDDLTIPSVIEHNIYGKMNTIHFTNNDNLISLQTKGGILADEMGLGKTISMLGLINYNQSQINTDMYNEKLYSNCSVIIVPSHLSKQWTIEIKKHLPNKKIIILYTKTHHKKITYNDIINCDILIISQQFLLNFNYYIRLNFRHTVPSQFNNNDARCRDRKLQTMLEEWIMNSEDIITKTQPMLEHFYFHRIIIDEGHEIFKYNTTPNLNLYDYLQNFLNTSLTSKYKWIISGTPYTDCYSLNNIFTFLKFKINNTFISLDNEEGLRSNQRNYTRDFSKMNNKYFFKYLLNKIIIRSTKNNVEHEINIPGYDEEIVFVKLTDSEATFYNSYISYDSTTLQQICCHPLTVNKFRNMIGSDIGNIDDIQDKMLEYNKANIIKYTEKIDNLNPEAQEYTMLKKKYTTILNESKFLVRALVKVTDDTIIKDEDCCICYDKLNDPVMTECGHIFCNECITLSLKYQPNCPSCRKSISTQNIYKITKKQQKEQQKGDPLILKYGTKLATLIKIIKKITKNSENKVIVFSQWDNMLSMIGRTLSENNITNTFIKGNIYQRNNAICKFKTGKTSRGKKAESNVIMLSLEHSASGTNLTEASHIIFIEPINKSHNERMAIEGQAIGRVCRIGKNSKVKILRIITENTIEEDIYKNRIEHDIVI